MKDAVYSEYKVKFPFGLNTILMLLLIFLWTVEYKPHVYKFLMYLDCWWLEDYSIPYIFTPWYNCPLESKHACALQQLQDKIYWMMDLEKCSVLQCICKLPWSWVKSEKEIERLKIESVQGILLPILFYFILFYVL